MTKSLKAQWLATYHKGDSRLREERYGILQLNTREQRIEFAVQTTESETSPIIIVNYPVKYLRGVNIIEKRQIMKKKRYLQLIFGDQLNIMTPTFSFKIIELEDVKNEILKFQKDIADSLVINDEKSETSIIEAFAKLFMTPIEQFQQLVNGMSSRFLSLTKKPVKAILAPLEPTFSYDIKKLEINGRKVLFYSSYQSHKKILLFLSSIGGTIENFFPLISNLLGNYQIYILGMRGYVGPIDQDLEFNLIKYIQDVKDFLDYIGHEKQVTLVAHSLFSAILLEEFLNQEYSTVEKVILVSAAHRAPDNFRKGVKVLPSPKMWGPFKGQVRKIAPRILFSKNTDIDMARNYINGAFKIPDKIYYSIFKDFLPNFDYTRTIKTLTKPLFMIWGKEDQIITKKLRDEMIEIAPPSFFSFKELEGGHMVFLENPENVSREINMFILSKRSQIKIE